ncbi:glycosyltransferase family 4 protein [Bacillus cereus]|uniref:glycosyltransferase family 4 protein n=1 Tax=Bacillus TaxID=1386 RepID=UPI00111DB998|nr:MULTISPECIES: glycosyltransferase family 4 protein [Bacillus]TNP23055.1 glycosyltransferase family 4 protein [Bacillus sp. CD3-5]
MKLLFVGDFEGNNGPASVNRALRKHMPAHTLFSEEKTKYKRIYELIIKIRKVDVVIFSGLSQINIIGFRLAKVFGKKAAYLMHGCIDIENKINQKFNSNSNILENKVLEEAPMIICVSEYFMNEVKQKYPLYKSKFYYVNNGLEWSSFCSPSTPINTRDNNTIISVGGGIPQKNVISICKAVYKLNLEKNANLKLVVVGKNGNDTNQIKSYPFVEYIGEVESERMPFYYQKSKVCVQNSIFETFGLAPIEALMNGCDLLLSNNVGVKSIFSDYKKDDIIYDVYDINELSKKIEAKIIEGNNKRLINKIDKTETSVENAVKKIIKLLESQINK